MLHAVAVYLHHLANRFLFLLYARHETPLPLKLLQIAVGFDSGLGSRACSYNSLTVNGIGHITCSKDTGQIGGGCAGNHLDESLLVEIDMALEKLGVGLMTNSEEETVDGNVEGLLVGFAEMTYQVGTLYTIVAKEPRGVGFEEYLDVLLFLDSLLHDLSSTQERLSHDHIHLLGETCQIESFLAGRVSTAHNSHGTLTIEETVAGGTCRYTLSLILLLVFKP